MSCGRLDLESPLDSTGICLEFCHVFYGSDVFGLEVSWPL